MSISFLLSAVASIALYVLFWLIKTRYAAAAKKPSLPGMVLEKSTKREDGTDALILRFAYTDARGAKREGEQEFSRRKEWNHYQQGEGIKLLPNPLSARDSFMTEASFFSQYAVLRNTMLAYPFVAALALYLSYSGAH